MGALPLICVGCHQALHMLLQTGGGKEYGEREAREGEFNMGEE